MRKWQASLEMLEMLEMLLTVWIDSSEDGGRFCVLFQWSDAFQHLAH
jgi:hypothetical protein